MPLCHWAFAGISELDASWRFSSRGQAACGTPYDLPQEHYRRFLDADLQYSCAYFAEPSFSLEQAQEAKKRHIAAKLLLSRASGSRHRLRLGRTRAFLG